LMAVRRLAYQRSLLERELLVAVSAGRTAGIAWSAIGHGLGTSGEAARQPYADRTREANRLSQ
jgi:hypothetical protein